MEREAAEKERAKIEEERRQQAALIDLQRRQEIIQSHLAKPEEKWERVKLPPPAQPPKPTTPRFVICPDPSLSYLRIDLLMLKITIAPKAFRILHQSLLKTNLLFINPLIQRPQPPRPRHLNLLMTHINEKFFNIHQSIFTIPNRALWSSPHIFRKLLNALIEVMMKFMKEKFIVMLIQKIIHQKITKVMIL
jgi:hypothetical protein